MDNSSFNIRSSNNVVPERLYGGTSTNGGFLVSGTVGRPLEQVVQDLTNLADQLMQELDILGKRLEPISSQSPVAIANSGTPTVGSSPIVNALYGQLARLGYMRQRLNEMHNAVEI